MTYVVELADDQLAVRAIHRMVSGLPPNFDLLEALSAAFRPEPAGAADQVVERGVPADSPMLVWSSTAWRLRPRGATDSEPDAVAFERVLAGLPPHAVDYHHDPGHVVQRVAKGEAQAGLLLRPPTVAQIAATARAGVRMPEKTTFFHPKPRTGMVFRRLKD
jgi:uncharacterized protein (DUF1015 family)